MLSSRFRANTHCGLRAEVNGKARMGKFPSKIYVVFDMNPNNSESFATHEGHIGGLAAAEVRSLLVL
jgi:hypothetical protein